jgi:hypothetical protein
MEMSRIEYIRKNGRKKGHKKGVLFCGIDPDDDQSVIFGFALCHPTDRFDYVKNQRVVGFGLEIAKLRAEKWKFHTDYFVQKSFTEEEISDGDLFKYINPDTSTIVEIPPSVMIRLKGFIERCEKYYKDKDFPLWIRKIEKGAEYPDNLLDRITLYKIEEIKGWE